MRRRVRIWGLYLLITVAFGCANCTSGGGNEPPTVVVSGAPSGPFVVGDQLNIQIDAADPEGGTVTFDWDHKPKEADWTLDSATFLPFQNSAVFQWAPLASDALNEQPIQLIFIVEDSAGQVTEKTVPITIVPGNGRPTFISNASELFDPRSGDCLEFSVKVADQDSEQVDIQMDPAATPAGAQFERTGPYEGMLNWCPSPQQLERRVHTVGFTADDGQNEVQRFTVTIVIRTAAPVVVDKDQTQQMCPGEAVISHTPLGPQRDPTQPYRFDAELNDPRFDRMVLYVSTSNAYNGNDAGNEEREGDNVEMIDEGNVWTATVSPYTAFVPDSGALTVYYQICAFDDDAAGLESIVCTPSSGDLELWHTFTVYAPDAEMCVDDGFDQLTGNDDFSTAAPITDGWEPFRVCEGNDDYFSLTLLEGESALFSAVYNAGANVNFEAFDENQQPVALEESTCTGLVTAEVEAPMGGGAKTFYMKATGDNTNYMLKAFKFGNAAECADAANEPNDSAATATPVTAGETVEAAMCHGSDWDVYSIDLTAGEQLTVTHTFVNINGNLDMDLFSPGQEVAIGQGVAYTFGQTDEEILEYTAEESGPHLLLVFNNNETATPYTLQFEVSDAPACEDSDAYTSGSPNHSQNAAAVIPANDSEYPLSLQVCPGKPDWLLRTEFEGATVIAEMTVTGGDGTIDDVTVQVIDENDNVVGVGTRNADRIDFDYIPMTTGPHYIKVETTSRVEYDLTLFAGR